MKKEEKNKTVKTKIKPKHLKPIQSTQQNIPIADISHGLIVDNKNQIHKILEIKPIPFDLMNVKDKNAVWASFFNVLKVISSNTIHIKSMGFPADLSEQIKQATENLNSEVNGKCVEMDKEFIFQLQRTEQYRTSHRFFISIPYTTDKVVTALDRFQDAYYTLSSETDNIANYLNNCGNEIVRYHNDSDETIANLELFYKIYNRNSYQQNPFENRLASVYQRYHKQYKTDDFFIPPSDIVAPDKMMYLNSKYIKIGDTYYAFLYISANGYPDSTNVGWLSSFIDSYSGVDVDIFLKKQPKLMKADSLRRSIGNAIADASETNGISAASTNVQNTLQSSEYLLDGIQSGQDIFDVVTVFTVSGKDIVQVEDLINKIKKHAKTMDMKICDVNYQCEEIFNAVLPFNELPDSFFNKAKRNILTEGAATFYPFTAYELIQEDGFPIGESDNSPVIPNFFNKAMFTNPHIFISGTSGAGKSVSIMLMALRAKLKHYPVFILAPEKQDEFKRLCAEIGGQFVSIGSGSTDRLNIFEIFKPDRVAMRRNRLLNGGMSEDDDSRQNQVEAKLATLHTFFSLYMGDDYTLEDQDLMNKALIKIYNNKGIFIEDEDSLWGDERHTKYKPMPTMQDLYEVLDTIEGAQKLRMRIAVLTTGAGSFFNGETNVDVDNEFFVIGLEHNTEQFLGTAMYTAMEYVWEKIRSHSSKNKMLIIDEWWKMAFNKVAAERTMKIARLARALGCSMVIATQQMNDIMAFENGKYGNAVLQNCATKIIMKSEDAEIKTIKNLINLTPKECSEIANFNAGEALLISSSIRLKMKFTPTRTEKMLTFTDEKTKLAYIQQQQEKIKEKERKEKIRNAKSFEETFDEFPFDM